MIARIATIAALVLGSAVVFGPTAPAGACTCVGMTDVEALASAEVAFTGELVEVQEPGVEKPSDAAAWFVFAVDTVYKGDAVSRQAVVTARDSASCGLEISGPGPFLVFASTEPDVPVDGRDGDLYSSLCSGTRPVAAGDLPVALGPGHRAQDASPPAAPAAPAGADDTAVRWDLVAVAGVAGAVVLAALAVWVGVRRRSGGVGGAGQVSGSDR